MAHSGVRPEVLGNYEGHDGLTCGDFPEMQVVDGEVTFEKIPTMVTVREEISKSGRKYLTFLSAEGCEYLKEYLNSRLRSSEKFHDGTDIIAPKTKKKSFIRSIKISEGIRNAIRGAGFKWRPYNLRCYFDSRLLIAESKGKMTHSYRQFFMGHVGDMEARYTTNKGRLPEEMIEDMRESYKNSQSFLQTTVIEEEGKEDLKVSMRRYWLKLAGMTDEEIEEIDLEEVSDEEISEIARKNWVGMKTGNGGSNKVVPVDNVEEYISDGWEYVNMLPGDKVVMRFPF